MPTGPGEIDVPVGVDLGNAFRDMKKFADTIRAATTDAEKLGAAISGAFGKIPQNGKAFQQAIRSLSSGGQDASAINARIRGQGAQAKATPEGQFAQIAKQQSAFIRDQIKGGKDVLNILALQTSEVNKGNRLAQQRAVITQRELNLTKALQQSGGEYTSAVAKANERLTNSNAILERMNANQKQAVVNAKYLEGVRARSALAEGRSGFAEHVAREKLVNSNQSYLNRLQVKSALTDGKDGINAENERANQAIKNQNYLDRLKVRSALDDFKNQKILAAAEDAAFQKKIRYQLESLKIEERRLKKELADAKALEAADEKRLRNKIRLQLNSIKIEEDRVKAEGRAAAKAYAASPKGLKEADDKARARRYDIAVGDGGAALFKLQTRLLAQYQVIGALFNGLRGLGAFIVDLDKSFTQLQAISAATDEEMKSLSGTIIEVSKSTKFSAVEIADAAVTLSQAGFSVKDIQDSIGAVTLLATASGSTLAESVDLASSVVTVFNLRAQEMGNVADITTGALNLTKLSVDKLALGVQYAGNIAADAGVTFTELTAVLGQASDAGIRSGSTLGTGFRQLLTEFENPSEKLQAQLKHLGAGLDTIDVKANGFNGVLKNLNAIGFSTADAMQALDVRAAAFFAAVSKGTSDIDSLQQELLYTSAATAANAVQMESLSVKFGKFANAAGIASSEITSGLVIALKKALDGSTSLISSFGDLSTAGKLLGTVLLSVVAGGAAAALVRMLGLSTAIGSLITGLRGVVAAGGGISALFATLSTGGIVAVAVGALVAAVTLLTGAFGLLGDETQGAESNLAKVSTRLNEARDKFDSARQAMSSVKDGLTQVTERANFLRRDQGELNTEIATAQQRFGDLGFTMEGLPATFEGLQQAYLNLLTTLQTPIVTHLGDLIDQTKQAIDAQNAVINQKFSSPGREKFITDHNLRQYAPNPDLPGVQDEVGIKPQSPAVQKGLVALDSKSLEEVTAAIRDVTNEQGGTEEDRKVREDLVKVLDQLRGALSQQKANELTVGRLTAQQSQQNLIKKVGPQVESAFAYSETFTQTETEKRLKGVKDSTQRDQIAKEIKEQAGRVLAGVIKGIVDDLNPDELKDFHTVYDNRLKSARVQMTAKYEAVIKENQDAREKVNDLDIQTLNDEIAIREKILSSTKDGKKREALKKDIIARIKRKEELELEALKTNKDLLDAPTNLQERAKANIRAQTQAAIDEVNHRDTQAANRPTRAKYEFKPFRDNENRATKDALDQVNQAKDRELFRAGQPSQQSQFRIGSYDLLRNQGKITDSQRTEAAKQQELIETQRLKEVAQIENERLLALTKVRAEAQLEYEKKLAEFNQLNAEAQSFNGTKEKGDELLALRDKAGREAEALNTTIEKSQEQVTEAIQKTTDAQSEYNARLAETKELTAGQAIKGGLDEFARQEGLFDSAAVKIEKTMVTIAGSVRDNLAGAFTDVVTGTKSMGEAFKDFGKNVIDTLIQIAAQQAANALIGLLIGSIGGGGGGTTQAATAILQNGQPRWNGGKIRMAGGGKVPGSLKTRDNVSAYLAPDEWVVNSSAAKSIGDKKMGEINQKGAAALSNNPIPAIVVPPAPAPVNVYAVGQDQVPPPSANDIIAIIGNDIARGGVTKKLIHQAVR